MGGLGQQDIVDQLTQHRLRQAQKARRFRRQLAGEPGVEARHLATDLVFHVAARQFLAGNLGDGLVVGTELDHVPDAPGAETDEEQAEDDLYDE